MADSIPVGYLHFKMGHQKNDEYNCLIYKVKQPV